MKVLFIGDVVGGPGRRGLKAAMPELRERHKPDLTIVNGENSAGGVGINEKTPGALFDAGCDVVTTGNHLHRPPAPPPLPPPPGRGVPPPHPPHPNPRKGPPPGGGGGVR